MADVVAHYDGSSSTYSQQYDPELIYDLSNEPANLFRLHKVADRISDLGLKSVFELGIGDGSPLAYLAERGLRVGGCDFSQGMLQVARDQFAAKGLDASGIFTGDIQDISTLQEGIASGPYDAVMALGVLPHVRSEVDAIRNMSAFIAPGGRLFLQFRNSMLSLFSFNRLTMEFIEDELLVDVPENIKEAVRAELKPRLAMDKPPKRTGTAEKPGYDEILAKFHNPFELAELVEAEGFGNIRYLWYNVHPAPPMLKGALGMDFRKASVDLEADTSWRGMFRCSAGVIEATKL